ncbi:MAG: GNAT family N-acetyltransferase [Solirubrobacterales bacterium]|nr:GNAT family N-acetyltransferase [Solirubrobacterales bacterium]
MHRVNAEAFAGADDYVAESLAGFTREHLEAHNFEAAFSRVATREDRVVGFLLARRWRSGAPARRRHREQAVGFVDILAVHPDQQGHGLGATLLGSAFAAFTVDGLREAQLGVSSVNARGLRLYERAGMTVRHRADIYERPLSS